MTTRAESRLLGDEEVWLGVEDKGRMVNEHCSFSGILILPLVSVPPVSMARSFLVLGCWRGLNP